MIEILKRYSLAFLFLFGLVVMMLLATLGVMVFGQMMADDIGAQEMQPRGKVINK